MIRFVVMESMKTMKCAMMAIQEMEMDVIMIATLSQGGSAWANKVRLVFAGKVRLMLRRLLEREIPARLPTAPTLA